MPHVTAPIKQEETRIEQAGQGIWLNVLGATMARHGKYESIKENDRTIFFFLALSRLDAPAAGCTPSLYDQSRLRKRATFPSHLDSQQLPVPRVIIPLGRRASGTGRSLLSARDHRERTTPVPTSEATPPQCIVPRDLEG